MKRKPPLILVGVLARKHDQSNVGYYNQKFGRNQYYEQKMQKHMNKMMSQQINDNEGIMPNVWDAPFIKEKG